MFFRRAAGFGGGRLRSAVDTENVEKGLRFMEKFTLTPSFVKNENSLGASSMENREREERLSSGTETDSERIEEREITNAGYAEKLQGERSLPDGEEKKDDVEEKNDFAPDGENGERNEKGEERGEKRSADNIDAVLSFMRAHEAGTRRILGKNKKPPFSR